MHAYLFRTRSISRTPKEKTGTKAGLLIASVRRPIHPPSMAEVARAREHHRNATLVGSGDHFVIAFCTASPFVNWLMNVSVLIRGNQIK